jgi:hypothetical protein
VRFRVMALAAVFTFCALGFSLAGAAQEASAPASQDVKPAPTENSGAKTPAQIPDLSGVWNRHASPGERSYAGWAFMKDEPPMTPWAEAKYKEAKPTFGPTAVTVAQSNSPDYNCLPPGVPYIYFRPHPFEFVQAPGRVIMLFEYDHYVREIYTDGRKHPPDLDPTWMGNSIGWYDGDTLVVDTVGFNDKTWLDRVGHPHSDQLHLVERFRRVDHDTLTDTMTIDDPKAYTKPWTVTLNFELKPDWTIGEFVCEEMLANNSKHKP